mgnify:CR=1 FL=1|tara:strand:+ start:2917 stop:3576 length:660 start_codon:yes stop_codon:yes gene_type:complete
MGKNKLFLIMFVYLFVYSEKSFSKESELLKLIQLQYKNISSFSGRFIQKSFNRNNEIDPKKAEGEVIYKRPGKMRWVYNSPEEHLLVTNGKMLWLFDPLLENVTVQKLKKITDGTALSFLLGIGDLTKDFIHRDISKPLLKKLDDLIVEIVPKKLKSNLAFIQLVVHRKTYNLKKILLMDQLGDFRTIELKSMKYNLELDDRLFEFKIPKGMEVIEPAN